MAPEIEKMLESIETKRLTRDERNWLWRNISARMGSQTPRKETPVVSPISYFDVLRYKRSLVTVALLLTLVFGTSTTAVFADDALPGDLLFPVDVAAEKVLLTISFGETRNSLRLQFAQERLDEVKALLAIADSIEIVGPASTASAATSTDSGSSNGSQATTTTTTNTNTQTQTSTSTDTSTNTTTSTSTATSTDDLLDNVNFDVNTVEEALLFALAQLKESREAFLSQGNELGVSAINSFIDELTNIADNHIEKLDRVSVSIKSDGVDDDTKIKISASSNELKTKFKFVQETDGNGDSEQSVSFRDDDSKSKLKTDSDGGFNFNFLFNKKKESSEPWKDNDKKNGNNNDDDDENDDHEKNGDKKGKDSKKDPRNDKKTYVCHKGKTLSISKNAQWAHYWHGDRPGKCSKQDNGKDTVAPNITGITATPTTTAAEIQWTTNEDATSKVSYSTTSPVLGTSTQFAKIVKNSDRVKSHSLHIGGLTASTTYYYVVESADKSGNTATSTEKSFITSAEPAPEPPADTTAPVISDISAVSTTTSATVQWKTDENATSNVWYGTNSPINFGTAKIVKNASLVKNHSLPLPALTASTTYYYLIVSADVAGNTATSSENSFATLPEPEPEPPADTTAPTLSSISATDIASTTATVSWTTDENATGNVFYGTSDPLDTDTAAMEGSGAFTLNHSFGLSDLTASTTYRYIVVSSDESGNTATSTQKTFNTIGE